MENPSWLKWIFHVLSDWWFLKHYIAKHAFPPDVTQLWVLYMNLYGIDYYKLTVQLKTFGKNKGPNWI